ncbi:MAG: hypothetical protein ABIT47_00690 [Candidatus Paceibacterota bacterium]
MKNIRAFEGPHKDRPFYENHEIERMCIEELSTYNLLPDEPSPIRIERYIEKRLGITPAYEEIPSNILGFTKFGTAGAEAIVVSRSLQEDGTQSSERRVRTTLAHEAGHALLHAHLFMKPTRKMKELFDDEHTDMSKVLCRDIVEKTSEDAPKYSWWEFQANAAMGALLLPENLFRTAANPFFESTGLLGDTPVITQEGRGELERSLADVFDVNPIVVRHRVQQVYFPNRK